MKPTTLHISHGPTPPMACPGCHAVLRSATGLSPTERVVPRAGCLTLCDQCFTWCTFVYQAFPTPGLRLRLATRDEVDSLDASLRELAEQCGTFLQRDDRKH
jgi:hypothetical protein